MWVSRDWKLIVRPQFTLVDDTPYTSQGEVLRTTGVGDTNLDIVLSPELGPWLLALGPTFVFPTANLDQTGKGKWQAGPAGVLGYRRPSWLAVLIAEQWWSFAGGSDRPTRQPPQPPVHRQLRHRRRLERRHLADDPVRLARRERKPGHLSDRPDRRQSRQAGRRRAGEVRAARPLCPRLSGARRGTLHRSAPNHPGGPGADRRRAIVASQLLRRQIAPFAAPAGLAEAGCPVAAGRPAHQSSCVLPSPLWL